MLRYKAQLTAEDRLMALNIATISQGGDKDAFGRFVDTLRAEMTQDGEKVADEDEFDRSAFEQLRGAIRK